MLERKNRICSLGVQWHQNAFHFQVKKRTMVLKKKNLHEIQFKSSKNQQVQVHLEHHLHTQMHPRPRGESNFTQHNHTEH